MSSSTPADLAVTFRSLARRQREAMGDADPRSLGGPVAELQTHVAAAAAALGTTGGADAVADAIERRAADDWDDATLATLRDEALAVCGALRRIAAAAEAAAD